MTNTVNVPVEPTKPSTNEQEIMEALDDYPKMLSDISSYGPDDPSKAYLRQAAKEDKANVLEWHEKYDGEKITIQAALHIALLNNKIRDLEAALQAAPSVKGEVLPPRSIQELQSALNVLNFIQKHQDDEAPSHEEYTAAQETVEHFSEMFLRLQTQPQTDNSAALEALEDIEDEVRKIRPYYETPRKHFYDRKQIICAALSNTKDLAEYIKELEADRQAIFEEMVKLRSNTRAIEKDLERQYDLNNKLVNEIEEIRSNAVEKLEKKKEPPTAVRITDYTKGFGDGWNEAIDQAIQTLKGNDGASDE